MNISKYSLDCLTKLYLDLLNSFNKETTFYIVKIIFQDSEEVLVRNLFKPFIYRMWEEKGQGQCN